MDVLQLPLRGIEVQLDRGQRLRLLVAFQERRVEDMEAIADRERRLLVRMQAEGWGE